MVYGRVSCEKKIVRDRATQSWSCWYIMDNRSSWSCRYLAGVHNMTTKTFFADSVWSHDCSLITLTGIVFRANRMSSSALVAAQSLICCEMSCVGWWVVIVVRLHITIRDTCPLVWMRSKCARGMSFAVYLSHIAWAAAATQRKNHSKRICLRKVMIWSKFSEFVDYFRLLKNVSWLISSSTCYYNLSSIQFRSFEGVFYLFI